MVGPPTNDEPTPASDDPETRAEAVLRDAQARLDATLAQERASRVRLQEALDTLSDVVARLDRGDPPPPAPPSSDEEPVAPAPVERQPKPQVHSSEVDAGPERELVETIAAAIRTRVTRP